MIQSNVSPLSWSQLGNLCLRTKFGRASCGYFNRKVSDFIVLKKQQQEESIPVGCVPPACRPYPVVSQVPFPWGGLGAHPQDIPTLPDIPTFTTRKRSLAAGRGGGAVMSLPVMDSTYPLDSTSLLHYVGRVGGTHPTGMLSCFYHFT